MIKLDQIGSTNDARRWQFSIGCSIVFLLICSVPISVRMMLTPIIGVQDSVLNTRPNANEVQRHGLEIEEFIEDKQRVASELLGGERVTYLQAADWHPPYISSDTTASALSQRIANWQNGTHTS